ASFAAARLMTPAYYSLSDSRTPMYLTVLSIGVNISLPLILLDMFHMSFAAMALTTSVAMSLEAVFLFEGLRRKLHGLDGRYLLDRFLRILAAALAMAVPLVAFDHQFRLHAPATRLAFLLEVVVLLPLAVLLFTVACRLFRV